MAAGQLWSDFLKSGENINFDKILLKTVIYFNSISLVIYKN